MSSTKFYYYNIWVEDDSGNRIAIDDAFDDDLFTEDNYQISSDINKNYFTRFQMISVGEIHGAMVRAKNEEGFVRLNDDAEMGVLSDETEGDGQTGAKDRDFVNYGIQENHKNIDLLLEVGYQTPGIIKFKEYLIQHLDEDNDDISRVGYETRMPDFDDQTLERLLGSELQKAEISFKKSPKSLAGDDARDTLDNLVPDEYRLKFETTLEPGGDDDNMPDVGDYVSDILPILGGDDDDPKESIKQIDFPRIMHTFRLTGLEEDADEEIEKNLAETADKEQIDMSGYALFDEDLGELLCNRISDKY